MGFWKNLFRKKKKEIRKEEEENEIVYSREGVDFRKEEERSRYIINCLEQIAESSKEMEILTGEYSIVTAYIIDLEEIEALPEQEKEEIIHIAKRLEGVEKERDTYSNKENRMPDSIFHHLMAQEDEIQEGIEKMKEAENYKTLIKQDLQRLEGERHAYEYRMNELYTILANQKGMATIFLTAYSICFFMLIILQFGFQMNVSIGYFVATLAAVIAIFLLIFKYKENDDELFKIEKSNNKIILLQNKVKIRYVNNTNLIEYLYVKYNVENSKKLEKLYSKYLEEKKERQILAEAGTKSEYYKKQLISKLSIYRVKYPEKVLCHISALIDKKEMLEVRHELIARRQNLRKRMEYNTDIIKYSKAEITDLATSYPQYAMEIKNMVDHYDRNY